MENLPVVYREMWMRLAARLDECRKDVLERLVTCEPEEMHEWRGYVRCYDSIKGLMAEVENDRGVDPRRQHERRDSDRAA